MKVGDKIICINNDHMKFLTLDKVYEIYDNDHSYYYLINDNNEKSGYNKKRFYSVKEYRKLKLEKINGR